jgi:6-phosphogluconate dehydrogenase
MNVTLGMVGLGRMGGNMSRRVARAGHTVVGWDRAEAARSALADEPGVAVTATLRDLVARLPAPRIVWLMLPAGAPTEDLLHALVPLLGRGDVVVDGGNAMYRDSQRHALELARHEIGFVDAGVSGGVWGLEHGYGLMVGGEPAAVHAVEPVLRALAPTPERGWVHCGTAGAGHYAKMVHNGIEYGMMQAYAEGFALLRARKELALDVPSIDSGEGRWTAQESIELGVPTPVLTLALMERFASQGRADYANRLLARMRQAFGGHAVKQG